MSHPDLSETTELPECAALVVGGGSGSRFGGDKLTIPLAGRPLLAWSLIAFEQSPLISSIVVVAPPGQEETFRRIAGESGISKLTSVVSGGQHRHDSVCLGLKALPATVDLVAIHDAARPLVTVDLIMKCLRTAMESGASAAAVPVTDTLHLADQERCAAQTVDRAGLWAMQTPQVFPSRALAKLLDGVVAGTPTDEVSLGLAAGWRVSFVESLQPNLKVTLPDDLGTAEAILRFREQRR